MPFIFLIVHALSKAKQVQAESAVDVALYRLLLESALVAGLFVPGPHINQ